MKRGIKLIKVVLPLPDGPTSAIISPGATLKVNAC